MDTTDYSHYYEDLDMLRQPWVTEPQFIPTVGIYGFVLIIGMVGNSVVVFAMVGDRKSRSITTTFLVSLAIADMLLLLVCVPYDMAVHFTSNWANGTILCKLSGFMETMTAMLSVFNLTAISVER